MESVDLHLEPNEASDLLAVSEPWLLEAHGWDAAYLTVLDDGPVERCVAVIGHADGADLLEGWETRRVRFRPTADKGGTEDCEALAAHDGHVVVVGSQYGSKDGPLQPKRHFLARFRLADLADGLSDTKPTLELRKDPFRLHRVVNDALREAGVDTAPVGDRLREQVVEAAVARGRRKQKRWAPLVREGDVPINVEGAEFRTNGNLLLGLRFPTTAAGHPIVVELEDVDGFFGGREPRARAVWVLEDVGSAKHPLGVRALRRHGSTRFDVVVGNLDSTGKGSVLVADHPEAGAATCSHWRFALRGTKGGGVRADQIHDFPQLRRVEGIDHAPDGEHHLYVVDADGRVDLRFLLADQS